MRERSDFVLAERLYAHNRWWIENAYAGMYVIFDTNTGSFIFGKNHDDAITNCRIAGWDSSGDYVQPTEQKILRKAQNFVRSLVRALKGKRQQTERRWIEGVGFQIPAQTNLADNRKVALTLEHTDWFQTQRTKGKLDALVAGFRNTAPQE